MNCEKAEEIFIRNDLFPLWQGVGEELQKIFTEHREKIRHDISQALVYFEEVVKKDHRMKGHLILEMHRLPLLEGCFLNKICLYDKNLYFGQFLEAEAPLFLPFIGEHFQSLWIKLIGESKKYVGKIDSAFIQNIMMKIAWYYQKEFALWLKEELKNQKERIPNWMADEEISLWAGEYMGRMISLL